MRLTSLRLPIAIVVALTAAAASVVLITRDSESEAVQAAVAYSVAGKQVAVAQVDGRGRVKICHRGSERLELGDVSHSTVWFVDGDVKSLPLPCLGAAPRTVVRIADVLGRAPRTDKTIGLLETLANPHPSPDSKRLAFEIRDCGGAEYTCTSTTYAVTPSGGGAKRIAAGQIFGWADAAHIVTGAGLWDPVAFNVDDPKQQRFLAFPRAWFGRLTPDGRRAFYQIGTERKSSLRGLFDEGIFEVDRAAGTRRSARLDAGALAGSADRSGRRFVELAGNDPDSAGGPGGALLRIYGSNGQIEKIFPSPVPQSSECDPDAGWFDARRAWVIDVCGAALVDVASGRVTKLTLPGLDAAAEGEPITTLHSIYEHPGAPPADATLRDPGALAPAAPLPGTRATLPPAWKAKPCRCAAQPYAEGVAFVGETPVLIFDGIGFELTMSATAHAPTRVLRAIRSAYAVGKTPPGQRGEAVDEITTRAQRVGGIQMTVLDLHSGVGATALTDSILVGRSGNRTYVITLFSEGRHDPSVQFILSALRFTSA